MNRLVFPKEVRSALLAILHDRRSSVEHRAEAFVRLAVMDGVAIHYDTVPPSLMFP